MKGWVAKLARGTTRLAFWRKPAEAGPASVASAVSSPSVADPAAADVSRSGWFARLTQRLRRRKEAAASAPLASAPLAAPVQAVAAPPSSVAADVNPDPAPIVTPPPPLLDPNELVEMLELSDPIAPSAHDDMLFGDDTPEEQLQALASTKSAHPATTAAPSAAADMAPPEIEPEPEPAEMAQSEIAQQEIAPAETHQADTPQPEAVAEVVAEAAAVAAPPSAVATPAEQAEPQKPKLVSRLLDILTRKWVWIPSVSVAMLAVMGSLSFMLMQSKQATHELQAELASAKKQLKQVPIKPEVVPPVLVAHQNVDPHQTEVAEPPVETVALAEAVPQVEPHPVAPTEARTETHPEPAPPPAPAVAPVAAVVHSPAPRPNIAMDCNISDKASVAKNLKNCIEAFNQATAR